MNKNLKLSLLSGLFILIFNPGSSQVSTNKNSCGSEVPSQEWNNEFQRLVDQVNLSQQGNKSQSNVYTIPVIIHVIHGGQAVGTYPNLAQGQLNSQILVLNNDYAGTGFNSSNYPSTAFSAWATAQNVQASSLDPNGRIKIADCGITFCLATKDTLGNILPEPGIDRINYVSRGWQNPAAMQSNPALKNLMDNTIKPQTVWNVSKYLNIWITDSDQGATGGLLGYATFPYLAGLTGLTGGSGTANTDGFWCYAQAFGSASSYPSGTYYPGYNRGRTSTHEIGHWLGLRHIWGDGTCTATDYVSDTPPASSSNFGSPTYPFKTTTCAGNSPNGEMYMNFMDYTNDPAKYMFTAGQATRIQTSMTNSPYRKFLGTHNLCSIAEVPVAPFFSNSFLVCPGVDVTLFNTSTGFPTPSYTWSSSGGAISDVNAFTPTINFPTAGVYLVTLAANNGTLSSYTKTITVTSPVVPITVSSSTICNGNTVNLTATGLTTYTWEPGGIYYFTASYAPSQNSTYTCSGVQNNGCVATGTVSVFVDACTGIGQQAYARNWFNVYPNPAKDLLHIASTSDLRYNTTVVIADALGNLILEQEISFTKEKQNQAMDISSLANGVYFVKISGAGASPQYTKMVKE